MDAQVQLAPTHKILMGYLFQGALAIVIHIGLVLKQSKISFTRCSFQAIHLMTGVGELVKIQFQTQEDSQPELWWE